MEKYKKNDQIFRRAAPPKDRQNGKSTTDHHHQASTRAHQKLSPRDGPDHRRIGENSKWATFPTRKWNLRREIDRF
jgi:hypothetical protein